MPSHFPYSDESYSGISTSRTVLKSEFLKELDLQLASANLSFDPKNCLRRSAASKEQYLRSFKSLLHIKIAAQSKTENETVDLESLLSSKSKVHVLDVAERAVDICRGELFISLSRFSFEGIERCRLISFCAGLTFAASIPENLKFILSSFSAKDHWEILQESLKNRYFRMHKENYFTLEIVKGVSTESLLELDIEDAFFFVLHIVPQESSVKFGKIAEKLALFAVKNFKGLSGFLKTQISTDVQNTLSADSLIWKFIFKGRL